MVRKKATSRKKLDLTNLDSLTATTPVTEEKEEKEEKQESETPESNKKADSGKTASVAPIEATTLPTEEPPESAIESPLIGEEKAVEKEVSEPAPGAATPIAADKEVSEPAPAEPPLVIVAKKPSRAKPSEATPAVVAKEPSGVTKTVAPEFIQLKKKAIDIQPKKAIVEATNQAGEAFKAGDRIKVKAPWGGSAIAEIVTFYQDNDRKIWAQYNPQDSMPKWTWSRGCTRASFLEKALSGGET